jgi:alginate O-acetyltransferase complex protein AlgI
MLFNSIHFLLFFIVVTTLYFVLSHKYRWVLLLGAGYYFYLGWQYEFLLLLLISTIFTFIVGRAIDDAAEKKKKKTILVASIIFHCGMLFFFKYFNFFFDSVAATLQFVGIQSHLLTLQMLLPIGISFYTFQKISYLVDIYNSKIKAERRLGIFALYSCFYPQLVAGPIERPAHLLPQFDEDHKFVASRVFDGLLLMLWGFFKKLVIADRLAILVNTIYSNPTDYTGIPLIVATIFFAFQLYCDFSGYTDIALGCAQVMGFNLIKNFKRPYASRSIADFWRRWHISLSSWFQDYVFNPLYLWLSKKNVFSKIDKRLKHIVVFTIAVLIGEVLLGLWHGANWTYAMFGLWHGAFISLYYITRKWWDKMHAIIQIPLTFAIVLGGFVFFRAKSIDDSIYILTHFTSINLNFAGIEIGMDWIALTFNLILIALLELTQWIGDSQIKDKLRLNSGTAKFIYAIILTLSILLFGVFESVKFIYFQF